MDQINTIRTLKVDIPEKSLRTAIRIGDKQKFAEVHATLVNKFGLCPKEDYGLFSTDHVIKFDLDRALESYGVVEMQEFVFKKFQTTVRVLVPDVISDDVCVEFLEHPDAKIESVTKFILAICSKRRQNDYSTWGLFYSPKNNPRELGDAILLEPSRTLSSYRLHPNDKLIYRDKTTAYLPKMERLQKHLAKTSPGNIFVVIESPVHGSQKMFGFPPATTIGEVVHMFTETNPVSDIQEYGLFVKATGVRMETLHRLATFKLTTLETLIFKRLESDEVTRIKGEIVEEVSADAVFGTDPAGLEQAEDYGFTVPLLLVQMRKAIVEHGGLEMEGLFRLAGEEVKMLKMKADLNRKQFTPNDDVFGMASLIKRWLGELPVRLFEGLTMKQLETATEGLKASVKLVHDIPEPRHSILMWFIYFLTDVAKKRAINLMDCTNLAIVVAPVLTPIPLSNPMEGLVMTGKVTVIVRNLLEYHLQKHEGVLSSFPSLRILRTEDVDAIIQARASAPTGSTIAPRSHFQRPTNSSPIAVVVSSPAVNQTNGSPAVSSPSINRRVSVDATGDRSSSPAQPRDSAAGGSWTAYRTGSRSSSSGASAAPSAPAIMSPNLSPRGEHGRSATILSAQRTSRSGTVAPSSSETSLGVQGARSPPLAVGSRSALSFSDPPLLLAATDPSEPAGSSSMPNDWMSRAVVVSRISPYGSPQRSPQHSPQLSPRLAPRDSESTLGVLGSPAQPKPALPLLVQPPVKPLPAPIGATRLVRPASADLIPAGQEPAPLAAFSSASSIDEVSKIVHMLEDISFGDA